MGSKEGVTMATPPFSKILDREQAAKEVSAHFQQQVDVLADMVNYGTNLIIRAYGSSEKRAVDVVVIGVLLKQMVAMLDAIEALLRAGIVHAAFLPTRVALEASLYLDWILQSDSERRGNCFIVANLRHERMWALRATKGTDEAQRFEKAIESLGIDMHEMQPDLEQGAASHLAEVNKNLSQPELQQIDIQFDAVRKKRGRDFDPEWYVPAGATSLRDIAKQVERLPQYEMCYSKGSHVTHSALYKDHIQFAKGNVRFKAIRSLRDIDELLNTAMPVFFGTYRRILQKYRAGEERAFAEYYRDNWREPFWSIKRVVIKDG